MRIESDLKIDLSHSYLEAKVNPEKYLEPLNLEVISDGFWLKLQLRDEQLLELYYALQQHIEATRTYETPDQQSILNAEHTAAAEMRDIA